MMRAFLIPRGILPHTLQPVKALGRSTSSGQLNQLLLLSRLPKIVRCYASGRDNGRAQGSVGGIISGSASSVEGGSATDPLACARTQVATVNNEASRYDNPNDDCQKTGKINSEMHATPTIGSDESHDKESKADFRKGACATEKKTSTKPAGNAASANNMAEDAVKQLQDVAANLPSKQQVEKFFFRVVAFAYDVTYLTGTWTVRFLDQKVVANPTVQHYWKRFHEKMQEAKKD
ncbi:uncharacterized protein LOC108600400 isoform X2 [Drosophila busckii]|uniref:uncharacterized protein LOC108600400 isoform X2 n=1 Tax=Drosophila busckii TaxID=30019 RepID=UPI00083F0B33|nr:uncharacterized protein LOC108600400 isoform X2 [Drosophila busckii]